MGLFDHFPYTNFHELNLSWILQALRELEYTIDQFVAINALKYADPIQWNIVSQYEKNTIVIDPLTGTAYISVQPVPSGVALTNTDYWSVVFNLGSFVTRAAKNFTTRWEDATTLTATFSTPEGSWLVWGDTLYKALVNITAGDQYVEDSNIQKITVEEVKNDIYNIMGSLDDLNTTDKSNLVAAINEVLLTLINTIGDLADLDTTDKSNLVAAIDEIFTIKADKTEIINVINMVENGCIADGSTDNSSIINDIISEAPAGSTLYFKRGTYRLENPINITKRLQIIGDGGNGYDAPTIFSVTNDGFYINTSGVVLKGFKVVAAAHCNIGIGIYDSWCKLYDIDIDDSTNDITKYFDIAYQCGNVAHGFWFEHLENCNVNNRYDDGLNLQAKMLGTGFSFIGAVNSLLTDCFISKKTKAISFEDIITNSGYYNDGITIDNINITWSNYGIYGAHATSIYFTNPIIDQINFGVYLDKCKYAEFTNMHIGQNNGGIGNNLFQTSNNTQYVTVINADIFGQGATSGIYTGGAKDCIYQNLFLHSLTYGINIGNASENINGDNILCNNVDYGIIAFALSFFNNVKGATYSNYNSLAYADPHIETITGTISDMGNLNYYGLILNQKYNKVPDSIIFNVISGGTMAEDKAISISYRKNSSTNSIVSLLLYRADNTQFNNESLNYAITLIYDK